MASYNQILRAGNRQFSRMLASDSLATAKRLQTAYADLLSQLSPYLDKLKAEAAKPGATARDLRDSKQLAALIEKLRAQLDLFSRNIGQESRHAERIAAVLGAGQAVSAMDVVGIVAHGVPSVAALKAAVSYADSAAFRAAVESFAPYHAGRVADLTLAGIAQGQNPVTVARAIVRYTENVPLFEAVRTTRTIQLWSARAGSRETYRANADIVSGWIWSAAIGDPRTCLSCTAMHGTFHTIDEILEDHHMGRCAMIPASELTPAVTTGEDWFNGLSEGKQREIMGDALFDGYRAGQFSFSDLSATYHNPVYGTMRREATQAELLS